MSSISWWNFIGLGSYKRGVEGGGVVFCGAKGCLGGSVAQSVVKAQCFKAFAN